MPGAKIAQAYITKHMPSSKAYLEKQSNHVTWDKKLEASSHKQTPPILESNKNLKSILQKPGPGNQTSTDINRQTSDENISSLQVCEMCTPEDLVETNNKEDDVNCKIC